MRVGSILIIAILTLSACSAPNTTSDTLVCDSPYIRFEAGCCLDQNNDSICDDHQTKEKSEETKTITKTTEAKETPTLPEEECIGKWVPFSLYEDETYSWEGLQNELKQVWGPSFEAGMKEMMEEEQIRVNNNIVEHCV